MIEYIIASETELEQLMSSRLEMLREVNALPADYDFGEEFLRATRDYFTNGDHTTVLALDNGVAGCATLSRMELLPTFSHPTGRRAHLMNVYTRADCRRQGVARHMVDMLVREARRLGVTEISLDATPEGRTLYLGCGFVDSDECMVLALPALSGAGNTEQSK